LRYLLKKLDKIKNRIKLYRHFFELVGSGFLWSKGYANAVESNGGIWFVVSSTQKLRSKRYYQSLGRSKKTSYWIKLGSHAGNRREDNLRRFVLHTLPQIKWPFSLITSDGDSSLENLLESSNAELLLKSPYLARWYAQNCVWSDDNRWASLCARAVDEKKLIPLPIGLDFHTDRGSGVGLDALRAWANVCKRKQPTKKERILVDFCSQPNCATREVACRHLSNVPEIDILDRRLSQKDLWQLYRQYAAVLSLPGHGIDCHRTWEALYLGAVPIVTHCGPARLYDGLPVIELNTIESIDWSQVLGQVMRLHETQTQSEAVQAHLNAKFGNVDV